MRRTKVTQIYKKTGNLRAVQLLLGHTKMDSTVRYLGVELEDARQSPKPVKFKCLGRLQERPRADLGLILHRRIAAFTFLPLEYDAEN
jgi:hypothetical protein